MKLEMKQESIPVGLVLSAAVAVGGMRCLPRGVSAQGVCLGGIWARGVSTQGVCIPACTEADPSPSPPWTEFLTHACQSGSCTAEVEFEFTSQA